MQNLATGLLGVFPINVTKLLNLFILFLKYLHNIKSRLIFALEVLRFI